MTTAAAGGSLLVGALVVAAGFQLGLPHSPSYCSLIPAHFAAHSLPQVLLSEPQMGV